MNYEELFQKIQRTAIITNYSSAEQEVSIGKSKFGGKPHLPEGFTWPYYEGEDYEGVLKSRPLSFLAQFNLEDVAEYDKDNRLPYKGMLYFFYDLCTMKWGFDPKDKGCARVFYVEDSCGLQTVDFPADLETDFVLPEFAVLFTTRMNLPDYEEIAEFVPDLEWDSYDEEKVLCGYEGDEDEEVSKLLGYADLIQGDMLLECEEVCNGIYCGNIPEIIDEQREKMLEGSKEWELLFQMSTVANEDYELMFGDCGSIYFYIKKQDLQKKNFDNIWLVLQCF